MTFLDGHYLLALDGTEYFSSKTIHCASCLHRVHRNGSITYAHQMLGAAIIHPDQRAVIPLMPEPIVNHDGTDKNDCERNAAKRFVAKLRQDHPHLKFIVTEDSLSSNAPHIETLHAHGLHYILGVKEGDHAYLFQQVQAAEHAGRVTYYERHDRAAGLVHRFRFVNDMPLNASHPRRAGQFHRVLGDEPGQGPTLQLGDGPTREQAQCLSPHAGWTSPVEDRKRDVQYAEKPGLSL